MSNPSYLQGRVSCPGGDEGSICPCQQGAFRCPGLPNRALAVMPSPVAFKTLAVSEVEVHLHVVVYSANSELLLEHRNNQSQDSLFQWGAPWWLKEKQNKTKKTPHQILCTDCKGWEWFLPALCLLPHFWDLLFSQHKTSQGQGTIWWWCKTEPVSSLLFKKHQLKGADLTPCEKRHVLSCGKQILSRATQFTFNYCKYQREKSFIELADQHTS